MLALDRCGKDIVVSTSKTLFVNGFSVKIAAP